MSIKDTKIIKGQPHLLAYITPNEVEKLKTLGGQETMTPEGIPAYPEFDNYGVSKADFNAGNFTNSTNENVRNLATGKTGVSASSLAAANRIEAQQKELKQIREEKARQDLKKQLMGGPVTNYSTNYFTNANRFAKNKFNKMKQKSMQKAILRTKDSNLEELGLIDSQGMSIGGFKVPSFLAGATSAFEVDPSTKSFDEDSIREIGGVLSKSKTGITGNQAKTLGDLRQDIQFENNPNISQNDFDEYLNRNKIITREGNDNILPEYAMLGGGADLGGEDAVQKEYDYHLGLGDQKIGRDVTLGYLANGGRAGKAEGGIMGTRARRAMGGIMSRVDQRQGYFLGKIVKGVKSAVSGVVDATTKVLKSDFGKAALLAGGAYMLGGAKFMGGEGMFTSGQGLSRFGNIGRKLLLKGGDGDFSKLGDYSMLRAGALGLGALTLFGNKAAPNETNFSDRGGSLIDPLTGQPAKPAQMRSSLNTALANANGDPARIKKIQDAYAFLPPDERLGTYLPYRTYGAANGGRIGKAEGGLMDLGGMEKDYRAEGGFVPIGEYEKKDDVPARLSVNEFVFTADAVRGAGQGDIDKGAEIMENMMENLENGGTVSEESQGNKGAQQMFETSERLGAVI